MRKASSGLFTSSGWVQAMLCGTAFDGDHCQVLDPSGQPGGGDGVGQDPVRVAALPASALWARLGQRWSRPTLLFITLVIQAAGIALPALVGGVTPAVTSAVLFGATFLGVASIVLALGGHLSPTRPGSSPRPGGSLMKSLLSDLGLTNPVLAAPMAGGPSTPAYVTGAGRSGSLGFLAAGYKTPQLLAEQVRAVRDTTEVFGVNLFAPNPIPVDREAFHRYAATIQSDAARYGIDLSRSAPIEDDDHWHEKIDLLLSDPVPVVSFTFAMPDPATISALRKAGTITIQTVTSVEEAGLAAAADVDALAVQANTAGGHYGTFTPQRQREAVPLRVLIATIQDGTKLPVIAAGGLSTPMEVAAVMHSGADAVMVGTVLLRSDESGASAVHKAAIADPTRGDTVITRAFTGRPARALLNTFIADHDAEAPLGYPALHHLTSELRKAAAADGNPELVNLWAGAGYRNATPEPLAVILDRLTQAI